MRKTIIAPSILSADFNHLLEDIKKVEELGAQFLHFDVMDGHFVNNISFGVPVLQSIAHSHKMINDVHIMISQPKKYAKKFIDAGANFLTFHLEACQDEKEVKEIIDIIHDNNAKAGISIKPNTDVKEVIKFIPFVDLVLIMSVEPGFGGQSFMINSLDKVKILRKLIDDNKYKCLIEIDGGINDVTAHKAIEAGVDVLVMGSYLFGHDDIKERMQKVLK